MIILGVSKHMLEAQSVLIFVFTTYFLLSGLIPMD